jgi:serine/threonine-protein phosphatase 5
VEIILTLLAYKVLDPTSLYLNRGNHETLNMNRMYGFQGAAPRPFPRSAFGLLLSAPRPTSAAAQGR